MTTTYRTIECFFDYPVGAVKYIDRKGLTKEEAKARVEELEELHKGQDDCAFCYEKEGKDMENKIIVNSIIKLKKDLLANILYTFFTTKGIKIDKTSFRSNI